MCCCCSCGQRADERPCSDGKTPAEQVQQILAVAPVLPKQDMPSQTTTKAEATPAPAPAKAAAATATSDAPAPQPATQTLPIRTADNKEVPISTDGTSVGAGGIRPQRVARMDSTTNEVDEFIDASS